MYVYHLSSITEEPYQYTHYLILLVGTPNHITCMLINIHTALNQIYKQYNLNIEILLSQSTDRNHTNSYGMVQIIIQNLHIKVYCQLTYLMAVHPVCPYIGSRMCNTPPRSKYNADIDWFNHGVKSDELALPVTSLQAMTFRVIFTFWLDKLPWQLCDLKQSSHTIHQHQKAEIPENTIL